jgi:cell division septation protein DedD
MEQFDIPHQRVKEKNIYHLHLDAARIILISSAVIAIIIVSFLLGMNFTKRGDGSSSLALNNDVFDSQKDLGLLKNNIPDPPDEEDISKPVDEKLSGVDKEEVIPDMKNKNEKSAGRRNDRENLLTKENISEADSLDKNTKKRQLTHVDPEKKKLTTQSFEDPADKTSNKSDIKNVSRKKKNAKAKVIEVSDDKTAQPKKTGPHHYAIQVASFDKKSTAQAEIKSLKENKYAAYLDETKVGGKQFFRVRIGPIASKKKAIDLLNTIQNIDRYKEGYMVRE